MKTQADFTFFYYILCLFPQKTQNEENIPNENTKTEKDSSMKGAAVGVAVGAAVGSVLGAVGTAAGAAVGLAIGSALDEKDKSNLKSKE